MQTTLENINEYFVNNKHIEQNYLIIKIWITFIKDIAIPGYN